MNIAGSIDLARGRNAARSIPKPNFKAVKKLRPTRKGVAIALIVAVALTIPAWLLLRNSSLVAVEQVRVVGLSGYYDKQARRAVIAEAEQMTTMNVDEQSLADAAGAFVNVAGVKVNSDFPHKLTIYVDVRRPVAAAKVGNEMVGLTGTGLILSSSSSLSSLPTVKVAGRLTNNHITDEKALGAVKVLGAAPDVLLRQVKSLKWGRNGLVITLNKGVELYFGDAAKASAKWRAAASVLAAPSSAGATYIDLRAPERPAIGGLGAAPTTVKASSLETVDPAAATDPNAPGNAPEPSTTAEQPATPEPTTAPQQQAPATTPQQAPPAGGAVAPQ
jgi:cell division protein FtsQ